MTFHTLDGTKWDKRDLLDKMTDDSFYYGYMGKNSLSSSSIKKLAKNPNEYVIEEQDTSRFDVGSLFHYYVLEPDKFAKINYVELGKRAGKVWEEAVEEHGKVYLKKDADIAREMGERLLSNSRVQDAMKMTRFEVPAVGYINGYPFRAKADILGDGYIIDLKTCQDVTWFRNDVRRYRYGAQVYIYCNLFNLFYGDFIFIAIDQKTMTPQFSPVTEETYQYGKKIVEEGCWNYEMYFDKEVLDLKDFYLEQEV